jgi:multicomponent Na+:H+ antiporter subunit C
MTANLTLILTASAMVGCGVYLLLERSLSRVLIGVVLMSNGVNVLILLSGGAAGPAPIVDKANPDVVISDPLPQALMLTAIVITLATTAFVLAMAYRSWQLTGHDDVQDDVEDAVIRRLAHADEASDSYDLTEHGVIDPDDARVVDVVRREHTP